MCSKNSESSESLLLNGDEYVELGEKNVLNCDVTKIEYTPSKQLHEMTAYDSTAEVIGYVDSIEASRLVGAKQLKIFKFYLNNGSGDRIQIVAWRCEVDRCESILKPNLILHIDGAYVKTSLIGNFNKGTINFELIIQSATKLNIFGYHSVMESKFNTAPELVLWKDIRNATKNNIRVRGFIKTNFAVIVKQSTSTGNDFGCGSITDGKWKIEIRIPKMENTIHEFEKGDHVEIEGELQTNANPIYTFYANLSMVLKKLTANECS